jgi:cholesterol transport system auxiliary component
MRRAAFVVALLLAGCAQPQLRAGAVHGYRLHGIEQQQAAPGVAPVVISVLPVDAAPGLGGASMLYSPAAGELLPYRDSGWLAPPPALVRAALAQTLARQPWVAAVEQDVALVPAPWLLHCELTQLEHDAAVPPGLVRLGLSCELVGEPEGRIAAHWRSDLSQPLTVGDAAHYAAAAQQLLDAALRDALRRVVAALQSREPAPKPSQ